MRLRVAAVAAVLAGAAMAGVGAAGMPAGAAITAATRGVTTAVTSATPLLTIRAIDREGKQVPVAATLQRLNGTLAADLTSTKAASVPAGTYNVVGRVNEPGGSGETLVDRELVVTKSATVTFDARQGRPVQFTVNGSALGVLSMDALSYFSGSTPYRRPLIQARSAVYAMPGTMAPGFKLVLFATLGAWGGPTEYVLIKRFTGAIPANLTLAYDQSKLAHDHVTVRSVGGIDDYASMEMDPVPAAGAPNVIPHAQPSVSGAPYGIDYYLSPGYQWYAGSAVDLAILPTTVASGMYSRTFNQAVFGPNPWGGPAVRRGYLEMDSAGSYGYLLIAPTAWPKGAGGGLEISSSQTCLYHGPKLLARAGSGGLAVTIPANPAWYTVRIQVNRTGADLFTSETDSYNFRAQGSKDTLSSTDFWPRIIPAGLNWHNAAKPGTTTTVTIHFSTLAVNIAAHNVRVWSSADDGKSWTALQPVASGSSWNVTVPNPATAGYVSLRVQGTNAAGFTASVTVIHAYAVG